jgi:hypothetical protein
MNQSPRLARLVGKVRPGFYTIGLGSIVYVGLRIFSPEREELMSVIIFYCILIGITQIGMGCISLFKPDPSAKKINPIVHPDSQVLRSIFKRQMLAASRLPVEAEDDLFQAAAKHASQMEFQIIDGQCWSGAIKIGDDTEYSARGYFGFANGRIGLAMVCGQPGKWDHGFSLVADYEQVGGVFTLRKPFGNLTAWGEEGSRLIIVPYTDRVVTGLLPCTSFVKAELYNFPVILKGPLGLK